METRWYKLQIEIILTGILSQAQTLLIEIFKSAMDYKQASKQPQIPIKKSHSPMGKYFSNSEYLTAMLVGKNSNKVNNKEKKKRKRKGNLQKIESAKLLEPLTIFV